jgi:hypothetical protein
VHVSEYPDIAIYNCEITVLYYDRVSLANDEVPNPCLIFIYDCFTRLCINRLNMDDLLRIGGQAIPQAVTHHLQLHRLDVGAELLFDSAIGTLHAHLAQIIREFAAKEELFKEARNNYTYHQINKVQEMGPDGDFIIWEFYGDSESGQSTTKAVYGTGKWKGVKGERKSTPITAGKPIVQGTS